MKLDRNLSPGHPGKYALIQLRKLPVGEPIFSGPGNEKMTVSSSVVDFGTGGNDFFVIRLKDKYACAALYAYAEAAFRDDPEYATEIRQLGWLSEVHPDRRKPD
jgi:hypothetical protein